MKRLTAGIGGNAEKIVGVTQCCGSGVTWTLRVVASLVVKGQRGKCEVQVGDRHNPVYVD